MKPYFYNSILGIFAFIVLIVPFTGKVHDGRRKWFRGFTIRGWIVCFVFFASMGVNYLKDLQADLDENKKNQKAEKQKITDDSISRKRSDESNAKIVNTFTSALAKYGYKYDSAQKIIKKLIRDSSKKNIKIFQTTEPDIHVDNIKISNSNTDSAMLIVDYSCREGNSKKVNMKIYGAYELNKSLTKFTLTGYDLPNNYNINKDALFSLKFKLNKYHLALDNFYILIAGNYMDDLGKKFIVYDLHIYDIKRAEFGVPTEPLYSRIRSFFEPYVSK